MDREAEQSSPPEEKERGDCSTEDSCRQVVAVSVLGCEYLAMVVPRHTISWLRSEA